MARSRATTPSTTSPSSFVSTPGTSRRSSNAGKPAGTPARIHHPGYVTGNPAIISREADDRTWQLDLLVPSAGGGIFHFVRTESSPFEWHMIGRIGFLQGMSPAACLSFTRIIGDQEEEDILRAIVQAPSVTD